MAVKVLNLAGEILPFIFKKSDSQVPVNSDKIYRAIGLMSGTSMDGVDLALVKSNGKKIIDIEKFSYLAYPKDFKERLRILVQEGTRLCEIKSIEQELTLLHAELVNEFLSQNQINRKDIDVVGFHGHTILHLPKQQITWQIGNSYLLASKIGINVVADFRSRDVVLGGQGAPLVPIYHLNLFASQKKPIGILNIGGISNFTYLASDDENDLEAFDVCFGNAPFDDLVKERLGFDFDGDGELARQGRVDPTLAKQVLQNEIFYQRPPKSFDRNDFVGLLTPITQLKIEEALATLAYIHAQAIRINLDFLPASPFGLKEIFVCGGGRKNLAIINEMRKALPTIAIKKVEEAGFNGDAIEAEAFAFLAIRQLLGLPISFPKTTGILRNSF